MNEEREKDMIDDIVKAIKEGAEDINRLGQHAIDLIHMVSATLEGAYSVSIRRRRMGAQEEVLSYHKRLVDQGVTADRALEFIADVEPPPHRALNSLLDGLGKVLGSQPEFFNHCFQVLTAALGTLGKEEKHPPAIPNILACCSLCGKPIAGNGVGVEDAEGKLVILCEVCAETASEIFEHGIFERGNQPPEDEGGGEEGGVPAND